MRFYAKEGEFAGKATEDDFLYEYECLEKLRHSNPEVITDNNVPLWQLVSVALTGEKIKIWRKEDSKSRQGTIVFRRFPYTAWRVADAFVVDEVAIIEKELDTLQSNWNVSDRKGTYLKSISRLAKALGFLHKSKLFHGNLYWRWFDHALQQAYARPNFHNVCIDGSVGDFEKPDENYLQESTLIDVREAIGAFSIYMSLIIKLNQNLREDTEFINNIISNFSFNLPESLRLKVIHSNEVKKIILDYENRLSISSAGKKARNGMEYFDDNFFAANGGQLINLISKFKEL